MYRFILPDCKTGGTPVPPFSVRYNSESLRAGWTVAVRIGGERKVRAPQDAVMGNSHRPNFLPPGDQRRKTKDRDSATESIPPKKLSAVSYQLSVKPDWLIADS